MLVLVLQTRECSSLYLKRTIRLHSMYSQFFKYIYREYIFKKILMTPFTQKHC